MSHLLEGRQFTRVYVHDPRSAAFPVTASIQPGLPASKHYYVPVVYDQGREPHCTAYSATAFRSSGPVCYKIDYSIPELYKDFQRNDQWLGENYQGSSVLGACRVMKKRGYITEYRWATTLDQVVAHLLTVSPMMLGTVWYEGMSSPDKNGFMRITGQQVGGHAYLAAGIDTRKKCPDGTIGAIKILNSWGRTFGQNGRAWLSFADFAVLLADQGEAATAIETPKGKI